MKVAIIGAGATGVAVFLQLVRARLFNHIEIYDDSEVGFGFAFGSLSQSHLCNTSVGVNSLLADKEDDFLEYLLGRGWPVDRSDFAPRYLVAQYCRERYLEHLKEAVQVGIVVKHIRHRIRSIVAHSSLAQELISIDGSRFGSECVVVCTGLTFVQNTVGGLLSEQFNGFSKFLSFAYPECQLISDVATKKSIGIIGANLSAVDAALALCERGKKVTMISRSGCLPSVRTSLLKSERNVFIEMHHARGRPRSDILRTIKCVLRKNGISVFRTDLAVQEQLEYDIAMAEKGLNKWQDLVADLIDFINCTSRQLSQVERAYLKKKYKLLISRYISAIPLVNARKVHQYMMADLLSVERGDLNNFYLSEDGLWRSRKNQHHSFDCLVMANGNEPVPIYFNDRAISELVVDGGEGICADERFDGNALAQWRVWVVGSTNFKKYPIVNYLNFSVDQARNVSDEIRRSFQ